MKKGDIAPNGGGPGWFMNELPEYPNRIEAPGPEYAALTPAERLERLPWLTGDEVRVDDPNAAFSLHLCGCIRAFYVFGQKHYREVVRARPDARHFRERLIWLEDENLSTAKRAELLRREKLRQLKLIEAAGMLPDALPAPPPAPAEPAAKPKAKAAPRAKRAATA